MADLINKVLEKYKLSDEQISNITQVIINTLTHNKLPSKNPLAIVVGGQPGAGKTALINYTKQISNERDFIVIDNDFFRSFHPKAEEIKQFFPEFFTQATDQLGMGITSSIINYFVENNYDLIFHQTLKNQRIGDDAISKFKDFGYTVGVRVFAVPFYESSMSQIERYLGQAEKLGYCRYATAEGHTTAYLGLPNTVEYLENNSLYDFIEVFKRSSNIAKPITVYTNFNEKTKDKTLSCLSNCSQVLKEVNKNGFVSAKDAVLRTRYETALQTAKNIPTRIEECEQNPFLNDEIQSRIDELEQCLVVTTQSKNIEEQLALTKEFFKNDISPDVSNYLIDIKNFYSNSACNLNNSSTVSCLDIQQE